MRPRAAPPRAILAPRAGVPGARHDRCPWPRTSVVAPDPGAADNAADGRVGDRQESRRRPAFGRGGDRRACGGGPRAARGATGRRPGGAASGQGPSRDGAAVTLTAKDHRTAARRFGESIASESEGVARAAEWALPRRAVVVTHSSSSNVVAALTRHRTRIVRVLCTASVPGGEGRGLAHRLERAGIEAE